MTRDERQLPYVPGAPRVLDDVPLEPMQRDQEWVLAGPCPRCGHEIWRGLGPLAGVGFGEGAGRKAKVRVTCNCDTAHPGSEGRHGCGAEFFVELER